MGGRRNDIGGKEVEKEEADKEGKRRKREWGKEGRRKGGGGG